MVRFNLAKQLLRELWKKKLRTFLGVFGVFWGTASVCLLLALGGGFYQASVKNLSSLASGALIFNSGVTNMSYRGYPAGRSIHLKANTIIALKQHVPEIKYISPVVSSKPTLMTTTKHSFNSALMGVNWSYGNIWKLQVKQGGRFLNLHDVVKQNNVIVIGSDIQKRLFNNNTAVGRQIMVWGLPFTVVGVLDSDSASSGSTWGSQYVLIPYTTLINIVGNIDVVQFNALPFDPSQQNALKTNVRDYLGYYYNFNPADKNAIVSPDLGKILHFFTVFFLSIQVFLGVCGCLTLTVGGISVANMMFLIVTEKTREIGLRMALGADRTDILSQVMMETFLIVAIGGLLGILFSEFIIFIMDILPLPDWLGKPELSADIMLVIVLILLLVTFFAGIFPAKKASSLQPVEALSF